MPLARAALYGQGEDLHVAIWPGNVRNTEDITRHIAREGRLDVAGHYSRPDVTRLIVNRKRQTTTEFND